MAAFSNKISLKVLKRDTEISGNSDLNKDLGLQDGNGLGFS